MALTASSRTLQKHVGNGAIQANIHTWIPIADTLRRAYHKECRQTGGVSKWSPAHEAHTFGQFIAVTLSLPNFYSVPGAFGEFDGRVLVSIYLVHVV